MIGAGWSHETGAGSLVGLGTLGYRAFVTSHIPELET